MNRTLEEATMIKDILVHVPTERPPRPVVDASVSLAQAFGAHLDALATGYISTSSAYVVDGSGAAAVVAVFDVEQEKATQRAAAIRRPLVHRDRAEPRLEEMAGHLKPRVNCRRIIPGEWCCSSV